MPSTPENRGLRLTLRTLLAWLDDTLPAAEVRQIGQQVKETPVAKELMERIQKVTRRRRLTVPPSTGPDSTDANTVANYLDNELTPDQVAEYEKRCLNSDVHLAEVASCHQILSMLGQKAKVPPEAKQRMYRLVKGREAIVRSPRGAARPSVEARAPITPVWPESEPMPPRFWDRYGLPVGVACLVLLMALSAWRLAPTGKEPALIMSQGGALEHTPESNAAPAPPKPQPEPKPQPAAPEPVHEPEPAPEPAATKPEVAETTPAGDVGTVVEAGGVALRWDAADKSWTRMKAQDPIRREQRLVTLAPFRTAVMLGPARLDLVGPADIRVLVPDANEAARFELLQGRVVLKPFASTKPVAVVVTGSTLLVTPTPAGPIGLTRINSRRAGGAVPDHGAIQVIASEGEVGLKAGSAKRSLGALSAMMFVAPDQFLERDSEASPEWVTAEAPSAAEQAAGKAFASYFKPEHQPVRDLAEALADDQAAIQELAVMGLGSIGKLDLVIETLRQSRDPKLRRAAIAVLRGYGDLSPESAKTLREQLEQSGDPMWAGLVQKLLDGFSEEEAGMESTYVDLVRLLAHEDLGVRELALGQLMKLTQRDAAGYDPNMPEGPGLKNWQDLIKARELPPNAAGGVPKKRARPN